MGADAQRDGCPAKYRWHPLLNAVEHIAKNVTLVQFGDDNYKADIYKIWQLWLERDAV